MNLVQKLSIPLVGLAAIIYTLGCSPSPTVQPNPTAQPTTTNQEYIRVAEKTSKAGEKVGGAVFGADGIKYFQVKFFLDGVQGILLVTPALNSVHFSAVSGRSDSVPYAAITECNGGVRSFQDSPQTSTRREEAPERAARIDRFLSGLYSKVGIDPNNCTIKPQ